MVNTESRRGTRHHGVALALGLALFWGPPLEAQDTPSPPATSSGNGRVIEGALISPVHNANVGAEVSGTIDAFHFNEGDRVEKGQVILELSPRRYELLAQRASSDRDARLLELQGIQEDERLKKKLLALHATTKMQLVESQFKEEVARARMKESEDELDLAKVNLEDCKVKAPFSGHLAVRYKQPHEPVDRLEKMFALVDSSKVYAVGNLPEDLIPIFKVGMRASFLYQGGKKFTGTIDRLAKLIDPQSRTKRIYVLIDNAQEELEIGMTGSIALEQ